MPLIILDRDSEIEDAVLGIRTYFGLGFAPKGLPLSAPLTTPGSGARRQGSSRAELSASPDPRHKVDRKCDNQFGNSLQFWS